MGFFYFINDEIMSAISYYTAEGLKKLRGIRLFKSVMRPKASADIAEARDKGDLSENAEYDAAKKHKECWR
jgi:transcription elongation factor GreA